MLHSIKDFYQRNPLTVILIVGLSLRLIAAVFSKGYAMTDDHFKIIAEASYEVHDKESTFWTPGYREDKASKRSMLYPYANYLFLEAMYAVDIKDPQTIMLINRLIHALFSMLIIVFTYLTTKLFASEKMALMAAWIAAIFWFLPMMSVRNLIEIVCIPFLMAGAYLIIKAYLKEGSWKLFFWGGVLLSFAFTIRYQTAAFSAGLGLYLMFNNKWKEVLLIILGGILPLIPNHLVLETLMYDFGPFEKLFNYLGFNVAHAKSYVTGPWYNFVVLFLGIFIPPFSFILARGVIRSWKKHLILLLPFLLFIVFHSVFPGKQERFILPVLMYFPIIGLIGYEDLKENGSWFKKHPKFFRNSWRAFLVVNIILLIPITLTYSKRSRVESMYYLADKPQKEKDVLLFMAGRINDVNLMPVFYSNYEYYPTYYKVGNMQDLDTVMTTLQAEPIDRYPDYVFIVEHDEKEKQIQKLGEIMELEFETTIEAGFIDKLMHWLNPRNKNYDIHVYKAEPKTS